jgi:hypothetical protein
VRVPDPACRAPKAAASHQQALALYRDGGNRARPSETLNCLGELASRTADGHQARDHHAQALAIVRDLGIIPEGQARALKASATAISTTANPGEAVACLEQALAIYQRIAAPATRRVQETFPQDPAKRSGPGPGAVSHQTRTHAQSCRSQ